MAHEIEKIIKSLEEYFKGNGWLIVQLGTRIRLHGPNRGLFKTETLADIEVDTSGQVSITNYPDSTKPFNILIDEAVKKALYG